VPSPNPIRIVQAPLVKQLLDTDYLVVCVGGGGVPVRADAAEKRHYGVQAVVDKDLASAALAADLEADMLIMLTDGDFVSQHWGTPDQKDILTASADAIAELQFAEGSMQPKVDAAIRVARAGGRVLIGPLDRLDELMARTIGTEIRPELEQGIIYV
jgi:carbamate kinase